MMLVTKCNITSLTLTVLNIGCIGQYIGFRDPVLWYIEEKAYQWEPTSTNTVSISQYFGSIFIAIFIAQISANMFKFGCCWV